MNAGASYFMLKPFDIKILGEEDKSMLDIDTDISSDSSYTKNKQSINLEIIVTDIIHQIASLPTSRAITISGKLSYSP